MAGPGRGRTRRLPWVQRKRIRNGSWPCWPVVAASLLAALGLQAGCNSRTPSAKLRDMLTLPSPASRAAAPRADRLETEDRGERYDLTPRTLIPIAFNRQPDIKSAHERYKSEEARYDFFYASNDSLTPQLNLTSTADEFESKPDGDNIVEVERSRSHTATLALEKRFFDTTKLDLGLGYDWTDESEEGHGAQPFASAGLRYPLWGSRERLERTSEEIFRRNELNDTQLDFIQTVRQRLRRALNHYYSTINNRQLRDAARSWREDLEQLLNDVAGLDGPDAEADRRRLEAEITSVRSAESGYATFIDVYTARLKGACGLPFHAQVAVRDVGFDPFEGIPHADLLQLGIATDPEIATLRNARDNAQVQLNLARRGRWDVALLLSGRTDFPGRAEHGDESDWSVSVGLEVAAVDARVTRSLIRQASADIQRYNEAIAAREDAIFVNTLEPKYRNDQLRRTQQELTENLVKYEADYQTGARAYLAGELSIDDLLQRRADWHAQHEEIAQQAFFMGMNVSSLCAETGKFFELLNGDGEARESEPAEARRPAGESPDRQS